MSADNASYDKDYNKDFVELDGAALAAGELVKKPGETLSLEDLAAQGAIYLSNRVADGPSSVPSTIRFCSQCGLAVWVDVRTVKSADALKVLCSPCVDALLEET